MRRNILVLIYTLIIFGVGWVLYVIFASNLNSFLFNYKLTLYNHELDSLFRSQTPIHLKAKHVYKSGEKGAIYYFSFDTLTNIVVIESTNYPGVFLKEIQHDFVGKIDLSQNKTYTTIVNDPFPLIQQVLNPRESKFLKISIEEPYQIHKTINNSCYHYLKGTFKVVVFGNTQNCSIVTFRSMRNNEILILNHQGNLYFVLQTYINQSLLELVNPALLD